jgi:hypothetical protein
MNSNNHIPTALHKPICINEVSPQEYEEDIIIVEVEECNCMTLIHLKINDRLICIRKLRPYVHSKY